MKKELNVGVVGMGVVGVITAEHLHNLGNRIYATDKRLPSEIDGWNENFQYLPAYSIKETDATFLILPTPSTEEKLYQYMDWNDRKKTNEGRFNESLDQKLYDSYSLKLGEELKTKDDYHLFVMRSTVEPGTTRSFGKKLESVSGKKMGHDFGMAMIPEFLRAYNSAEDIEKAKLLVAGVLDEKSLDQILSIYENLPKDDEGNSRIYPVSLEEAELVKLESNALNAIWISLHNARLSNYEIIEEKTGMNIDYDKMTKILTSMTETFTNAQKYGTTAGLFYGGTCLKKDPGALLSWLVDKNRIQSYFSRFIELGMHMNLHLQTRILNDHIFSKTLKDGIPERLMRRNHETYDNIEKIRNSLEERKY